MRFGLIYYKADELNVNIESVRKNYSRAFTCRARILFRCFSSGIWRIKRYLLFIICIAGTLFGKIIQKIKCINTLYDALKVVSIVMYNANFNQLVPDSQQQRTPFCAIYVCCFHCGGCLQFHVASLRYRILFEFLKQGPGTKN